MNPVRAPLLILLLCAQTYAFQFTYSATLNGGSPRMDQPYEDLSGVYDTGPRGNVSYSVQAFTPTMTATYTFLSRTTSNWDQFLVLYQGFFNAFSPLTNALIANSSGPGDPGPGFRTAGFTYTLLANQQYYIVTMGEFNGERGDFTNSVTVPEPATYIMTATALVILVLFRRRRLQTKNVMGFLDVARFRRRHVLDAHSPDSRQSC